MKTEYLTIGLVVLAGLVVGYTFFQETGQNNIKFSNSMDTNKSTPNQGVSSGPHDQRGSSSQGTGPDHGGSSSQEPSSDQVNDQNQGNTCPDCGGDGYIDYIDENGILKVDVCPTCGGSGHL